MLTGDFVTEDAGCGVVHCAPAFDLSDWTLRADTKNNKYGDAILDFDNANLAFADLTGSKLQGRPRESRPE